jgi:DNA-binding Lrp family transcriptional regulator
MEKTEIVSGFNLSIDQGVASHVGVDAALIFNHIIYWLRINAGKSDAIQIDGKYWMYETNKQMAEFFGFMSEDSVSRGLKKLKEAGLIEIAKLSKNPFDHTSWYTVCDQGLIKKSLRNPQIRGIDNRKSAGSDTRKSAESIYTTEEQQKNNNIKPPPATTGGGKEKASHSLIYKNTKGEAMHVSESDIYSYFLKLPYETYEIQEAIEEVRSSSDFIGNIFKYIEAICLRIHNSKSLKKKDLKKKEECNIKDTSNEPKVNFGEYMKKHHGIDLGKKNETK